MKPKLLYGVLNWGLGHASRSSVLIQRYLDDGCDITIASDGEALEFLKQVFPTLKFVELNAYQPIYPKNGSNMPLSMAKQIPKFLKAIKKEHRFVEDYCKSKHVDAIVSDNRYGFYHKKIKSSLLCHQLTLHIPQQKIIDKAINNLYTNFLQKFDEFLVPDNPPPQHLTGKLSAHNAIQAKYIGILSQMHKVETRCAYDICVLLSGPEPQRSMLEEKMKRILPNIEGRAVVIRGKVEPNVEFKEHVYWDEYNYLHTQDLNAVLNASKLIVCRSGYSSVMDMATLEKRVLFVPTPGQTEQEYLAEYLKHKPHFFFCKQENISQTEVENALNFGK